MSPDITQFRTWSYHSVPALAQGFTVPSSVTPAVQFQFQASVANLARSAAGGAILSTDIQNAAALSLGMVSNFTIIGDLLVVIDSLGLGPTKFTPAWNSLANQYNQTLILLKNVTDVVSLFAGEFDASFLPFVVESGISNEVKVPAMQVVLENQISQITPLISALNTELDSFTRNLSDFTNAFASFAASVDPVQDTPAILDLLGLSMILQQELNSFRQSMSSLGSVTGTDPFVSQGYLMFPFFNANVSIGAGIAAGILNSGISILVTEIGFAFTDTLNVQAQIQALRDDLSLISAARGFVNRTAGFDLGLFSNQVSFVQEIWTQGVEVDTNNIIMSLQSNGAPQVSDHRSSLASMILLIHRLRPVGLACNSDGIHQSRLDDLRYPGIRAAEFLQSNKVLSRLVRVHCSVFPASLFGVDYTCSQISPLYITYFCCV
ncbi:hypothetical protein BC834DRAFT_300818 [Gloeopeniophorella convolvens]|nr:hypothetical protein BC834DRAFT_300818 [Gloeopeniophorella convolvens]